MIHIVLASHGRLAASMKESIGLIMGNTDAITAICAYCEPEEALGDQIDRAFARFLPEDTVVVVTDVFGGSVNNEFMKYVGRDRLYLIAGMNLPLVIQLVTMGQQEDMGTALKEILEEARKGMVYCNTLLTECQADEEDF